MYEYTLLLKLLASFAGDCQLVLHVAMQQLIGVMISYGCGRIGYITSEFLHNLATPCIDVLLHSQSLGQCCRSRKSVRGHIPLQFASCLHPVFSTGSNSTLLYFCDSKQRPTERTTLLLSIRSCFINRRRT